MAPPSMMKFLCNTQTDNRAVMPHMQTLVVSRRHAEMQLLFSAEYDCREIATGIMYIFTAV